MNKLVFSFIFLIGLSLHSLSAQDAVLSAGGEASGNGGSASYSVGQTAYTYITGNGGSASQGVQQTYQVSISVKHVENIDIQMSVYPNPTTDQLHLKVADLDQYELSYELYDAQGKEISRQVISEQLTQLRMQDLPAGSYFLRVSTPDTPVQTFSIIKNR